MAAAQNSDVWLQIPTEPSLTARRTPRESPNARSVSVACDVAQPVEQHVPFDAHDEDDEQNAGYGIQYIQDDVSNEMHAFSPCE